MTQMDFNPYRALRDPLMPSIALHISGWETVWMGAERKNYGPLMRMIASRKANRNLPLKRFHI